jgi:hypothetical protein
MWKWIKETFWFFSTLFMAKTVSYEETVFSKIMEKYPGKNKNFTWWCGYVILGINTKIDKVFREKYYTRYNIRFKQVEEFNSWIYYYLVFIWYFLKGKPWISWKGAYYTNPFVVESLYYENKSESIFFVYPYGKWKNFILEDRQKSWSEGKKYWKTWIRNYYDKKE